MTAVGEPRRKLPQVALFDRITAKRTGRVRAGCSAIHQHEFHMPSPRAAAEITPARAQASREAPIARRAVAHGRARQEIPMSRGFRAIAFPLHEPAGSPWWSSVLSFHASHMFILSGQTLMQFPSTCFGNVSCVSHHTLRHAPICKQPGNMKTARRFSGQSTFPIILMVHHPPAGATWTTRHPRQRRRFRRPPLGGEADHLAQQIGVGALFRKGAKVHHLVGHRRYYRYMDEGVSRRADQARLRAGSGQAERRSANGG